MLIVLVLYFTIGYFLVKHYEKQVTDELDIEFTLRETISAIVMWPLALLIISLYKRLEDVKGE